ncbi:hypothetical protein [Nonomuraea sp. NPDC005650]|uniref:hypothetical protein n=1 Tax=Nonomuraea sp. NPDC005650 TaxID=3157045 RepID=UPI00339F59C5
MSRTAHHIDRPIRDGGDRYGKPWRSVTIVDLRYSAACLREAERAGHRARPASVRHRADVYSWARADLRDRWVAQWARNEERQARRRLRLRLEAIRRTANAAEPVDDLEVHPARHRRNALWLY